MIAIVANWLTNEDGQQYTFHLSESKSRKHCFEAIDSLGDPHYARYKICPLDIFYEMGKIATQEDIKSLYEGWLDEEEIHHVSYDTGGYGKRFKIS